jgi:hypothetical protein
VTYFDKARNKIMDFVYTMKDAPKGESDVAGDSHVAGSRAAKDDDDGSYVGRTTPDVALDVEQSGAEARSEQKRLSS